MINYSKFITKDKVYMAAVSIPTINVISKGELFDSKHTINETIKYLKGIIEELEVDGLEELRNCKVIDESV